MVTHARVSARQLAVLCAVVLAGVTLAACGSSPTSSADWKTPQDVIDGIKNAGLPCRASGEPTIDTSSESKGYQFIACDGYGVILITDRETFDATDQGNCTRLDDTFMDQAGKQEIVTGPTFRIASVAQSGAFPPNATAAALAKGLGGEATTLGQYYAKVCGIVGPSPPASAG